MAPANTDRTESSQPLVADVDAESSIDWIELFSVLWSSRQLIIVVTAAVAFLVLAISLLLPNYYKATVVLLPEMDKNKLGGLAGISSLASLAGVNVGDTPMEKLYPSIMRSETVLREVVFEKYVSEEFNHPVNLIEYWEIEDESPLRQFEVAVNKLAEDLNISLDKQTNVLSVHLLMKEPQLAADVLNKLAAELDNLIRKKRTTSVGEQRKWIEARLDEVKEDLEESENALKVFREKNRRILDSPKLLLEQQRLTRESAINETLYAELKKQYELVRIEEIKNLPIVNVLDTARAAARKEKPRRLVMVLVSTLMGFLGITSVVFLRSHYRESFLQIVDIVKSKD